MVVNIPRTRLPIPGLPPFDPESALSLQCVCKLGLVPGHDGRRIFEDELRNWSTAGRRLVAGGPDYLFPTLTIDGKCVTTAAWCAAWVKFVCEQFNDLEKGLSTKRPRRRRSKAVAKV